MINNITLTGRIASDIDLKTSKGGDNYLSLKIAVKRSYGEKTDFIWLKIFGKNAEFLNKYMKKGSLIGVVGRLQVDSNNKNGEWSTWTGVVVSSAQSLETKSETAKHTNNSRPAPRAEKYDISDLSIGTKPPESVRATDDQGNDLTDDGVDWESIEF